MIVRGGIVHLQRLTAAFHRVVFLSGTPYVKTMKRKRLVRIGHAERWVRHRTEDNEPLDALLALNTGTYTASIAPRLTRPQTSIEIA